VADGRVRARTDARQEPVLRAEAAAFTEISSGTDRSPTSSTDTYLQTTVERLSHDGGVVDRGLSAAPRVSVNYGAAGIAYFFYRLALTRAEPAHLLTASRWLGWAQRQRDDPLAFHDRELSIVPERVGRVSIYHSAAGTACVEALVANATGDLKRAGNACMAFVSESGNPCASLDLTVGRASTIVGAALLVEALRGTAIAERRNLVQLGDQTLTAILGHLAGDIQGERRLRVRGMAHGWAGVLYAALRWCEATNARVPDQVNDRLAELASLGRLVNGNVSWHGPQDPSMIGGWCHGAAGYIHLWSTAARVLHDDSFGTLAVRAAESSWAGHEDTATLCCGLAGQAYAMHVAYQVTGDQRWVERAENLTIRAVRQVGTRWCLPNSLWKGDVGIALAASDLHRPQSACMPLFASEGWPVPARSGDQRAIGGQH
jgi:hypothetical protein